jgi:nicotinamide N-methyltransferase
MHGNDLRTHADNRPHSDINYLNCPMPPPGCVSVKQQRDKYRQRLLAAFDAHYHPDHSVPAEFKEAFPAGRFRPVCKIQAKRGASPTAIADVIQPPDWWNSTRIIQAFDSVLQDRVRRSSTCPLSLTLTSSRDVDEEAILHTPH